MQHRRRRSAVGLLLVAVVSVAAWLVVTGAAAESPATTTAGTPPVPFVIGSVDAAGVPAGPPVDWTVVHDDDGSYEVSFSRPTRLAVRSWEAVAGVIARPVSDRTWSVRFANGGQPVDTSFTFLAAPIGG